MALNCSNHSILQMMVSPNKIWRNNVLRPKIYHRISANITELSNTVIHDSQKLIVEYDLFTGEITHTKYPNCLIWAKRNPQKVENRNKL